MALPSFGDEYGMAVAGKHRSRDGARLTQQTRAEVPAQVGIEYAYGQLYMQIQTCTVEVRTPTH